jgi:CubicO group peptidase (beta-lactamase class C family)
MRLRVNAVAVAHLDGPRDAYRGYSSELRVFDEDAPVEASCVAKLVTSLMLIEAAEAARLDLSERLDHVLACHGVTAVRAQPFADVSVRQLLDHTHGLDGSDLYCAPLTGDGFIDLEGVCDRVGCRPRLHAPGRLYSYSHVGHVLAGALLERIGSKRFAALVFDCLHSLGIEPPARSSGADHRAICPAGGGGLQLSARAVVRLLRRYWTPQSVSRVLADVRPLPGYTWTDNGFSWGWRCQEGGWMYWIGIPLAETGDTLVLRFNPGLEQGLVVAGRGLRTRNLADLLAAELWGGALGTARPLSTAAQTRVPFDPRRYVGTYEDCTMRIEVNPGSLGLTMTTRATERYESGARPLALKHLRSAGGDIFFCLPPDRGMFHFAQFIREPGASEISHFWDGVRVWRRV